MTTDLDVFRASVLGDVTCTRHGVKLWDVGCDCPKANEWTEARRRWIEAEKRADVNDLAAMVTEFHRAMGAPNGDYAAPAITRFELRTRLMREELKEYEDACAEGNLIEAVDGLIDLLYVTVGTLVEMGVEVGPAFAEAHRSNMSKTGGPVREDGKILKGPNYSPLDLSGVLSAQIARRAR
jgi:predicted HAD superfamily Cof-like phosphohydrolase